MIDYGGIETQTTFREIVVQAAKESNFGHPHRSWESPGIAVKSEHLVLSGDRKVLTLNYEQLIVSLRTPLK